MLESRGVAYSHRILAHELSSKVEKSFLHFLVEHTGMPRVDLLRCPSWLFPPWQGPWPHRRLRVSKTCCHYVSRSGSIGACWKHQPPITATLRVAGCEQARVDSSGAWLAQALSAAAAGAARQLPGCWPGHSVLSSAEQVGFT